MSPRCNSGEGRLNPGRARAILLLNAAVLAPTLGWAQQSLGDQSKHSTVDFDGQNLEVFY